MNNPRLLLVLFALAFLVVQVTSYMSGINRHEERLVKLEKQMVQPESENEVTVFENTGTYKDLKWNPSTELEKEKIRFRAETLNFIIKVLIISGATAFVFAVMKMKYG
jgi:hypothetical protein